jgi:hypothetical protein
VCSDLWVLVLVSFSFLFFSFYFGASSPQNST